MTGQQVTGDEPEPSPKRRAFREALLALRLEATSPDGWIHHSAGTGARSFARSTGRR